MDPPNRGRKAELATRLPVLLARELHVVTGPDPSEADGPVLKE